MIAPWISDTIVIATIGGIVSIITAKITSQSKKNVDDIMKRLDTMGDKIKEIQGYVKETNCIGTENRIGIQKIARFKLYNIMSQAIKRGWTTIDEVREVGKLFEAYEMLDGNGEIHDLHELFLKLEIRN